MIEAILKKLIEKTESFILKILILVKYINIKYKTIL